MTDVLKGNLFNLDSSGFTVHGFKVGFHKDDWVIQSYKVDKIPISPKIIEGIKLDRKNKVVKKIKYLLVTPRVAGILYLEGKLTAESILKGVEGSAYVEFPEFRLNKVTMILRVVKEIEGEAGFATANKDLEIL